MSNYYRRPSFFGGFGLFPPVIKILLILNIGIFLIERFFLSSMRVGNVPLDYTIIKYFALNPIGQGFLPWQFVSYMFLHGDFAHVFFNMFALWMFGMDLENIWGSKRFAFYYFLCGIGAGVVNLLAAPLLGQGAPTIGASGAIYGVLVAFGYFFPNRPIYLYFFVPIKAKYVIILYMVIEVFALTGIQDGIAHIAHLGGGVIGFIYLLIIYKRIGNIDLSGKKNPFQNFSSENSYNEPQRKSSIFSNGSEKVKNAEFTEVKETDYKEEYERQQKEAQARIDAILDKLSQGGYQSLTDEEKKILFNESKKLR
ncbi:MAG: rhomboid family intramembrane serine protease [Ignavibacteria bacterium]|nr:rhomboid family intramembrane serine protease [Ignavibacteria bacterium]